MGKSRSTTLIISYLLTQRPPKILSLPPNSPPLPLTPTTAISLIRQSRPMVEPNPGFMQQLELYYSLGCPADVTSTQAYKRWRFDQEVRESVAIGRAPEQVRFEDDNESNGGVEITPQEHSSSSGPDHDVQKSKRHFEYRCRKCRHSLSATPYLVSHTPKPNPTPLTQASNTSNANPSPPPPCAHIYTQPLLWMKPELSKGNLNGRLNCPKCNTNVGKYAWQGLKCSCGAWMVPAITLARTRVDEVAMTRREGAGSGGAGLARNGSSSDVGHVHEQEKGDTLKQTNDELARSRERLRNLGIRMPPNVNVGKM
ncbi:MAG: tyrosine protein phosphatase yvh1 [Cirrosporium novae-zelandiae]|nr:MAG: tyrosine protein phosphatase yvh1 [Cirrosporium novae-zelandiae]